MTVTAMPATAADAAEGKKSPKKLILVLAVLLVVLGGGTYFFVLKPSGPVEPVPGEVVALDPIQVNLASGHYLRVGIALQLTADAHEADGSAALDALIEVYSNTDLSELVTTEQRERKKEALMEHIEHDYHGDVMGVFYTEFVTQ
ncbi:MAG TPA: flagellar basal body-associated FliL family protein [Nocardioides sp.]